MCDLKLYERVRLYVYVEAQSEHLSGVNGSMRMLKVDIYIFITLSVFLGGGCAFLHISGLESAERYVCIGNLQLL